MDYNLIMEYIRPELLILIPFLWGIGWLMKNSNKVLDWVIPIVLFVLGMIFAPLWIAIVLNEGFSSAVILYGIVQGGLVGLVAVGVNEIKKQSLEKRPTDQAGGSV